LSDEAGVKPCIDLADLNARQVRWIDQDQLHVQKNAILLDWAEVMMLRPGRRSGKTRGCHFSSRRPYVFGLAKIGSASFARFYAAEELRNDGCLGRKTLARAEPLTLRGPANASAPRPNTNACATDLAAGAAAQDYENYL